MTLEAGVRSLSVAMFSVVLWSLLLAATRVLLLRYAFDPWSFTFIQLFSGGLLLVVISMRGPRAGQVDWRSLRRRSTWLYGILRVTTAGAFTAALSHVSVVHGGLLGVINVPLASIGVAVLYGRWPARKELPGHLLILIGIVILATRLDGGLGNPAVVLMLISELAVVGSSLIAERHPDNNASDPRARSRFSGVVLLVTAALFLMARLVQGLLLTETATSNGSLDLLRDWRLWMAGLAVGALLRGPAMHTALQAIRLVGAETYLVMVVFLPFFGWGFEVLAARAGAIPPTSIPPLEMLLGAVIAGGSLFIMLTRARRRASSRQAEHCHC